MPLLALDSDFIMLISSIWASYVAQCVLLSCLMGEKFCVQVPVVPGKRSLAGLVECRLVLAVLWNESLKAHPQQCILNDVPVAVLDALIV